MPPSDVMEQRMPETRQDPGPLPSAFTDYHPTDVNEPMSEDWSPHIIEATPDPEWMKAIPFDLFAANAATFNGAVEKLKSWAKDQAWTPLSMRDAWYKITPQLAEQLLIRNKHNRDMKLATVLRYAGDMKRDRWLMTGEPIIVTTQGFVEDAGHRLTACYFGNVPFISKVVVVPHNDELFAVIDNGEARTGAQSLATSGIEANASKLVSKVVRDIAIPYDENVLVFAGSRKVILPVSNRDILNYTQDHPALIEAAATCMELYPLQRAMLKNPNAVFLCWKIEQECGKEAREEFFDALASEDLPVGNAIHGLKVRIAEHEAAKIAPKGSPKAKLKLSSPNVLALSIKAFNEARRGHQLKRLDLRLSDPFPRVEGMREDEDE